MRKNQKLINTLRQNGIKVDYSPCDDNDNRLLFPLNSGEFYEIDVSKLKGNTKQKLYAIQRQLTANAI